MRNSRVSRYVYFALVLSLIIELPAWGKPPSAGNGGSGSTAPAYDFAPLDYAGGTLVPAYYDEIVDLNESGCVLGHVEAAGVQNGPQSPAFWAANGLNSQLVLLDYDQFDFIHANGMNDLNEIVGYGFVSEPSGNAVYSALYWPGPQTAPIALPSLTQGSGTCFAESINNAGLICGTQYGYNGTDDRVGVVWRVSEVDGEIVVLDPVALPQAGYSETHGNVITECDSADTALVTGAVGRFRGLTSWTVRLDNQEGVSVVATSLPYAASTVDYGVSVSGINNSGVSCGAFNPNGDSSWGRATLWTSGLAVGLANPPQKKFWSINDVHIAYDINDAGKIVGEARNQGYPGALLWLAENAATAIRLEDLLPKSNSRFSRLSSADAINNSGVIVGVGSDQNGNITGYIAVPK